MKKIQTLIMLLLAAVFTYAANKAGVEHSEGISMALGGVIVTPDIKRGHLAIFTDYISQAYGIGNVSDMDLTPFNLRLLTDIKNGVSQYVLNPKEGYKGSTATLLLPGMESKLEDGKIYFFPLVRVATRKNNATTGVLGPVFTYEDKAHHDAANEVENLHSLYNGNMTFKTGNNSRINKLTLDDFRYVPAQQKEEATDVLTFWPQYGPTDGERGYVSIPPTLIIDSSETNSIEINLVGITTAIEGAADKKNILCFDAKGWVFDPKGGKLGIC